MMQSVCRSVPARPQAQAPCVLATTACPHARVKTASRACGVRVAPAPRLRVCRAVACVGAIVGGGGTAAEPVEEKAEELEVLEEAAIAGDDEGRRPTDYDRRAHIFEESSRVFQELKHRRDGEDDGVTGGDATAAGTAAHEQQQLG